MDVRSNTCIDSSKENNFKIGDTVRISKCKNKDYTPNCSEEVFYD